MNGISFGFKTPAHETVKMTDYDIFIDGTSLVNASSPDEIGWSDRSQVDVTIDLSVSLSQLTMGAGFSLVDKAQFGSTVNWKATGSGLHGSSPIDEIKDGLNELSLTLPGHLLGDELVLRPEVLLLESKNPSDRPLSPWRLGSRLWSEVIRVRLEGSGSQFPTTKLNFKENDFSPVEALWRLRISGDLDSHFSSAVRLYLNTGASRTAAYLEDPTAKSQREFANFLEADIVTQLLTFAFNSDAEHLLELSEQEGSLAEALMQIYYTYFPTIEFVDGQGIFQSDPGFLSSTVLGKTFHGSQRIKN